MNKPWVWRQDDQPPRTPYEQNKADGERAHLDGTPSRITGKPQDEEERADANGPHPNREANTARPNPVDAARRRDAEAGRTAWRTGAPSRVKG